ncbi:hypothetical protein LSH36_631g01043 [Paralvinella palmiformis]|uniref:PX domain-containing protein n=1 Tax=Paralvinella palmiformis TaxID=53620 RepID=A0AAD9J487_9ANNE|nr:hypothetical protein LSH36_631g01043 [Paralvinella palmiformis]
MEIGEMNIIVKIPSFRKYTDNEKSFTVFSVEVHHNNNVHTVDKRYTDFEELHKQVKQSVNTPPFPHKTVLKWNQKVLESRRVRFEQYLQGILNGPKIPRSLLKFLELNMQCESLESLDKLSDVGVTHQPMLAFSENSYVTPQQKGSLPDILVAGVLQGLYGSVDDLR